VYKRQVYVDGAYLLRSKNNYGARWERIAYTAEYLKMLAKEFGIPIIATYQFNRKGSGDVGNIGGSDVVGQLAGIAMGITNETDDQDDVWSAVSYKHLELVKGREGESGKIRVLYDMEKMKITQDSVLKGGRSDYV